MKEQLEQIKAQALQAIHAAADAPALDALRVRVLGKKGELTAVLKQMGRLSAEERPVMGQLANGVRAEVEAQLERRKAELEAAALEKRLAAEAIDVTVPGKEFPMGHQHPMNKVLQEVKEIFVGMGYTIVDGPEVEEASYNFTRLNIEEGHPSRDRSDTFYFNDDDSVLLRTQTSPMQIRAMDEIKQPPIRVLAPGRVYRKDEVDATHSPMFHQIEGLVIDKGVTMADLKGTLETLAAPYINNEKDVPDAESALAGARDIIAIDIGKHRSHTQYDRRPNVTYIRTSQPLGGLLTLDSALSARNRILGYNDVMRAFGRMRGVSYAFDAVDAQALYTRAQDYVVRLTQVEMAFAHSNALTRKRESAAPFFSLLEEELPA